MSASINQLFIQLCVVFRAILAHKDATAALIKALTSCAASTRNGYYEPHIPLRVTPNQALDCLKAITFGLQLAVEDDAEAHAIELPAPVASSVPLAALCNEFCELAAQIMEHPETNDATRSALNDLAVSLTNEANGHPGHPIAWARYLAPHCLYLLAGVTASTAHTAHNPGPHVSEAQLVEWIENFATEVDEEAPNLREAFLTGLMVLLWNVANQKTQSDCMDLADRLIDHVYGHTATGNACKQNHLLAFAAQMPMPL